MKTTRLAAPALCALALPLVLAACGEPAATGEDIAADAPAIANGGNVSGEPVETASAEPAAKASPETVTDASSAIPARFLGTWDYVGGKCAGDSDMRLEVTPTGLTFYESIGEVQNVRIEGDYAIVDLKMEGEGETWDGSYRMLLTDAGELHLTEPGSDRDRNETPRVKCTAI